VCSRLSEVGVPRFFFHLTDTEEHSDTEGTVLADLHACRLEAIGFIGELIRDHGAKFWATQEWSLRVTDATGLTLFVLYLGSVNAAASRAAVSPAG
jgi:hypothetical protein